MVKARYILIHKDKYVYRFNQIDDAKDYGMKHCRGSYEFYIIVDTEEDQVVYSWSY